MNAQRFFATIMIALFVLALPVSAQKSDRAIVDNFESQTKSLIPQIDSAKTVQECADISAAIDEIEKTFLIHIDLLNRALYPDDYATTLTNLKGRLLVRQKDLGVIETQFTRIMELEAQVRELSGKVDSLSRQNDRLLGDAKRLEASVKENQGLFDSLSSVIKTLRENLKQRDDLIFALVDSLFLQYDKNVASLNDVEKQGVAGKLERRNVLTNIKKSISDNMKFIESTSLTPGDFVQLLQQHNKFQSQWKGIGSKLASVYSSGKQKKNDVVLIDSMLSTWSVMINSGTWKTISGMFEKNGIVIKPFANGGEFYANFTSFVDAETKNEKQEHKDVRIKRFQNFNDYIWNAQLDTQWLPALVEAGMLTPDQKIDIEKKVDAWRSSVAPTSWTVCVLLLLLAVIVIAVLVRFLRKKPVPN
ncbi:MAG: hypothetical protein WAV76_05765 [Bacteroidota bacterium]